LHGGAFLLLTNFSQRFYPLWPSALAAATEITIRPGFIRLSVPHPLSTRTLDAATGCVYPAN
jgi:hypothetical protein